MLWVITTPGASSSAPAGKEEKLFLWVTADLQGILTEVWFGIYYIGKKSPIWGTVPALLMRLSVYSGLAFKNPAPQAQVCSKGRKDHSDC